MGAMKMDNFEKATDMLENLLQELNIDEITKHITEENLNYWLMHWRSTARICLSNIRRNR